jgi:hypothetical protein
LIHTFSFSRTLLEVRWPFANGNGDNSLEFAPNSMLLFLGVGDGGSSYDPFENAQNPGTINTERLRGALGLF